jgi:hypothetical protein
MGRMQMSSMRKRVLITAAVLLALYALHPLIPPEWAQPVRHFFRELLRALT